MKTVTYWASDAHLVFWHLDEIHFEMVVLHKPSVGCLSCHDIGKSTDAESRSRLSPFFQIGGILSDVERMPGKCGIKSDRFG